MEAVGPKPNIQFLYFDLGNVLLNFDHVRAARQMAEVASVPFEVAWEAVFGDDMRLELAYERGDIGCQEFHAAFCQRTSSRPNLTALLEAGADIFEVNDSVLPILERLRGAGHRLGILSNTNRAHWEHVVRREYSITRDFFELRVLSYEARALKPESRIYEVAADVARARPAEIFFTDDRPDNVQGALAAGWNATRFTTAEDLERSLVELGVL